HPPPDVPRSPSVAEPSEKEEPWMKSTTIAVDVAKEVLEVAVSVRPGQVRQQKRLTRTAFMKFCTDQPPATVLLEACGSAHYWGRRLQALGHRVVLLPPHATRPYVFRNKTDRTDTRGLLEAYRNESIHSVPVKSVPQQALTACTACAPLGWPPAPPASTPSAACCASSAAPSPSGPTTSSPGPGTCSPTPTRVSRTLYARPLPKPAE